MKKLVNTTALSAAFVAVCFALVRDYGLLATLKRASIAYFVFFAISAVLVMIFRAGIQDEWIREDWAKRQSLQEIEEAKRTQSEAERLEEMTRRKTDRKKQLIGEGK